MPTCFETWKARVEAADNQLAEDLAVCNAGPCQTDPGSTECKDCKEDAIDTFTAEITAAEAAYYACVNNP